VTSTSELRSNTTLTFSSDEERFRAFGRAIDAIHDEAKSKVGEEDLRYIRNLDRLAHVAAVSGRLLLALGPGPISFVAGVASLWVHKQLHATEIGHTVLHGAFNKIPGEHPYRSSTWNWRTPIDEQSWIRGHNGAHHGLTNVEGDDPDVEYGPVRLTTDVPHRPVHYVQLPFMLFILMPNFSLLMNLHFTDISDVYSGKTTATPEQMRERWRVAMRKYVPYYAREALLYPALSLVLLGPWAALRMAAGNFLAERMRDLYSAATIFCGHVGERTAHFAPGTRPRSKGERQAMQVEAANNFQVPRIVSIFCGALDLQIEHHLFPTLPTERLREVAPAVRAACEAHGVEYRQASWPRTLANAIRHVARLSFRQPDERAPAQPHTPARADEAPLAA
jgi:linoleoyl-CoA desaturase